MKTSRISSALPKAAKKAGLNAVQIAAAVGVSEMTAVRWLRGDTQPKGDQVLRLFTVVPGFAELVGISTILPGSEAPDHSEYPAPDDSKQGAA
jgi:transcriptional regulator with XRE-family HTH domain